MIILGICGQKKSGKSTIAGFIKEEFPHKNIFILGFADALKKEVADGCGVSLEYIEQNKDNFRLILQGWGSNFRRELYGEGYWLKKWLDTLNKLSARPDLVIVPDVRFLNEAKHLRNTTNNNEGVVPCKIFRIIRNDDKFDLHQSEIEQEDIKVDAEIRNKFLTLIQLHNEVISLFRFQFPDFK